MLIEAGDKGSYKVLRIKEDLSVNSDLTELRSIVNDYIAKGSKDFAFSFTKNSFLYTRSIAVLITCSELIKENNGRIAIIEANDDILDLLNLIDFDSMIKVYPNEEDLVK